MIISVNPAAEVSTSFEAVQAATYPVRITEVKNRNPEKNDLEVTLEHVTPKESLLGLTGEVLKGQPSRLRDYVMLAPEKHWKLRALTEAARLPWQDYDPETELVGLEVDVVVKLEEYNGEQRNKVSRYIVPK